MPDLILAVLCSASIALLFAKSERMGLNRYAVTAVNYAVAVLVGVSLGAGSGAFAVRSWSLKAFLGEIGLVIGAGHGQFSPAAAPVWALMVGIVSGGICAGSFLLYQHSVRRNGPALSGMFGKLGILLPVILSLLVWRDLPTAIEWLGIGLALGALLLPSLSRSTGLRPQGSLLLLVLLFLAMGAGEFSNKLFQAFAPQAQSAVFLSVVFSVAFVGSLVLLLVRGGGVGKRDLLMGLAVGVPNLLSSWFLIRALDEIKAAVAFPLYSVGGMSLIALGGVLLLRERLSRYDVLGLLTAAVALVLLSPSS